MARSARIFLVRRTRDNLSVVFARRASRVGTHGLGTLEAVSERVNRISIKNIEESEARGKDFFEIRNVSFRHWFTRNWDDDRNLIPTDIRLHYLLTSAAVMAEINKIIGFTIEEEEGDEGGSGLSTVGGTSVTSFRMESVNYGLEDGSGFLLDESSNNFVSEELNTVLQRSDGTFLSVDTRSVSHGGGGGSAGNPVVSGTVSGTDLILTLDDATTVTIDATKMVNGTTATIGLPNWYQTYDDPGAGSSTPGPQINTLLPDNDLNPYYFGITLKKGREFTFSHSTNEETIYYGIWGGSTSYTPSLAGAAALWTKHIRVSSANDEVRHGTNQYDSVGWDLSTDYPLTHGTTKHVLQYEQSSNKLKLWDVTDDYWNLIATASTAEDGDPVIISAAVVTDGALPSFSDREHTWNIIAQVTEGADASWHDGLLTNSVIKHNTGLHPGEKMVTVTPPTWMAQYIGFDYTGAALGETGVATDNTAAIQVASNERLYEKTAFTINTKADRYDTSNYTDIMGGKTISFRYHLDYSMDVYDEENEEVLFTKDADFDGSTIFMHLYLTTNINLNQMFHAWTFEPFAPAWYYNPNNYQSDKKPNVRHIGTDGAGSRTQWGEKMYPGQELIFQENQGGSGNTYIGIRNSDDSDWHKWVGFDGTYLIASNSGFDITTQYGVQDKWLAMRYDFGDHKLKFYDIETTGVETLITTADVAEDGNAIRIAVSGNNYIPGASTVLRYYGWEYVHTHVNHPQSWGNWRLDRPSVNSKIAIDTVTQQRRALIPGYFVKWQTAQSGTSNFTGKWKDSNAATGVSNPDQNYSNWDWGFRMNNSEQVLDLKGFTFNTSNPDYDSSTTRWDDPDKGTTIIGLRYTSANAVDLYDFTNSVVIATKDADLGGEAVYIACGQGTNVTDLADNFFGGGDVTFGTL